MTIMGIQTMAHHGMKRWCTWRAAGGEGERAARRGQARRGDGGSAVGSASVGSKGGTYRRLEVLGGIDEQDHRDEHRIKSEGDDVGGKHAHAEEEDVQVALVRVTVRDRVRVALVRVRGRVGAS